MESIRIKGENVSKWVDTFVDIVLDKELQLHLKNVAVFCVCLLYLKFIK